MSFKEARLVSQSVPRAREVPVAAGQAFELGALGTLVDGEFTEAASPNPTDVTYVAQTPFGAAAVPFDVPYPLTAGAREFPPGRTVVTDALATTFRAEFLGDLPAAPGGLYGVEIDAADGRWKVNFATVAGDLIVRYLRPIELDVDNFDTSEVEVEFLAAAETVV